MKVSIALATYNGEKFIKQQLESIAAQTTLPNELIICDDASVDRTIDIIDEFSRFSSINIRIFKNKKNIGFVKNFENAILHCSGDYIAIADQDDIWEPEKIKTLVERIQDAFLIHSDALLINSVGDVISESYTRYSRKKIDYEFVDYLFSNNVTGCTSLFKKELIPYIIPIPQGFLLHDWWFALQAVCNGKIVYLDKPLTRYRQHDNNQIGASLPASRFRINNFEQRDMIYSRHCEQLMILKQSEKFSGRHYEIISDFVRYYSDYRVKKIRPKSFLFHLKYFKYFQHDKSILIKILALCASFFGRTLQARFVSFLSLINIKI